MRSRDPKRDEGESKGIPAPENRGRGSGSRLGGRSVTPRWDPCSDVGVELPLILMHPKPSNGE